MSKPKPQFIANLIVQHYRETSFKELKEVIHDTMCQCNLPGSDEDLWDYAEMYLVDIANELFKKESEAKEKGIITPLDIDEERGTYYVKNSIPPYNDIYKALHKITPGQFESFCASIVQKLGWKGRVNGGTIDEGIDFIGEGIVFQGLRPEAVPSLGCFLVGQAKHYCDGHQVVLKESREFVGAAIKFRDKLLRQKYKVYQPFLFAYWTTSDFHQESVEYFQNLGVWSMNGVQLSSLAFSLGYRAEDVMTLPEPAV